MNSLPLKFKIVAIIFSVALLVVPLSTINDSYKVPDGVYICGPASCTDPSPNHLSYYCDDFHKYFWEIGK